MSYLKLFLALDFIPWSLDILHFIQSLRNSFEKLKSTHKTKQSYNKAHICIFPARLIVDVKRISSLLKWKWQARTGIFSLMDIADIYYGSPRKL